MRRAALIAPLAAIAVLAGCGGGGGSSSSSDAQLLHPSKLNAKAPQLYTVQVVTTKGDFTIDVHRTWAPNAADRFYNLVKGGFFSDVKFFRVVPNFVVQFGISGDPKVSAAWKNATIPDDQPTVPNNRGAVTFASAGPNTRTTQIFINLVNNTQLSGQGFAPFGDVVTGMDVVDRLYSGYSDQPTSHQSEMMTEGNAWLDKHYPKLDSIKSMKVTHESNPALP